MTISVAKLKFQNGTELRLKKNFFVSNGTFVKNICTHEFALYINNICSSESQRGLETLESLLIIKCNFEIDCSEFKTHLSNRPNTYKRYDLQRNIRCKFIHINITTG